MVLRFYQAENSALQMRVIYYNPGTNGKTASSTVSIPKSKSSSPSDPFPLPKREYLEMHFKDSLI